MSLGSEVGYIAMTFRVRLLRDGSYSASVHSLYRSINQSIKPLFRYHNGEVLDQMSTCSTVEVKGVT